MARLNVRFTLAAAGPLADDAPPAGLESLLRGAEGGRLADPPTFCWDDAAPAMSAEARVTPRMAIVKASGHETFAPLFLDGMYGNEPACWDGDLHGVNRLRVITNYFTRMRFCTEDGTLDLKSKEGVGSAPPGYAPWFSWPSRKTRGQKIIFGHWAALEGQCDEPGLHALDSGCVWGGAMTLMNIDSGEKHRCDCKEIAR